MKYAISKEEKYILLALQEEKLDATISPQLKSTFVTLNAEGMKNLVLDLSGVKYVDSSGLGAILIANRLCTDAQGSMVLAALTEHVSKIIKIAQLESVLNISNTTEEAVDFVLMTELENDLKNGIDNKE